LLSWTSEVPAEAGLTGTTADRDQRLLDHHHRAAQSVSGVKLHWLSQPWTSELINSEVHVSAPHCPPLQLPCLVTSGSMKLSAGVWSVMY